MKDAIKGINMFRKTNVEILGLVQNMSLFQCPHCSGESHIFGTNERVEKLCKEYDIDFLGDIPLHPQISQDADMGKPTVVAEPTSARAETFLDIGRRVGQKAKLPER